MQPDQAEGEITGRDPAATIGKDLFRDVAPWNNRPPFKGEFDKRVGGGSDGIVFEYFDYNMKPIKVKVDMKKALSSESCSVFVKRI